ncbi:hypothetical protein M885DRAFT_312106 [Pelagophyceae sp. CCMP2097]|nr:hypothetical protein M885DRAFT_312106 [Pelagophyceae sp. CCMP2097]
MYSLGLRNQQEQAKRSQEAIERRHAKPADGARRDHHLLQVYGKTHAEMMSSGQQRREDLIEAATFAPETSSSLRQQVDPPGRVHYHTFRDRSPSREVGPQTVSSLRYVPRAVYGGGGALDRARTAKLENRREPVNALEPRLGTASLHDIATSRGRVRQQTYEAPGYFLRARERSLELGPPLRFEAKNEMERVNSHLESLTIADAGQWAGTLEVNEPVWRTVDQRKWKGLRLRLNTAPATNTTHTVDGTSDAESSRFERRA